MFEESILFGEEAAPRAIALGGGPFSKRSVVAKDVGYRRHWDLRYILSVMSLFIGAKTFMFLHTFDDFYRSVIR